MMPNVLYRSRYVIAIVFATLLLLSGCKKSLQNITSGEILFEQNILNRNFVVDFASENGTDITNLYTTDTFRLTKTTSYYDGVMTGKINSTIYTGTWTANSDYSKLEINITTPSTPTEFNFINRAWKFTKKTFPVMELAPWFDTGTPKILNMRRLD